jgi:hypothetical protein
VTYTAVQQLLKNYKLVEKRRIRGKREARSAFLHTSRLAVSQSLECRALGMLLMAG